MEKEAEKIEKPTGEQYIFDVGALMLAWRAAAVLAAVGRLKKEDVRLLMEEASITNGLAASKFDALISEAKEAIQELYK